MKNTPSAVGDSAADLALLLLPALILGLVAACDGSEGGTEPATAGGDWPVYGGDLANRKFAPLDQIHAGNVDDLEIAWRWRSPAADLPPDEDGTKWAWEATPLVVDGTLYVSTSASQVAALDPATGETIWVHDPDAYGTRPPASGMYVHRGVAHWANGEDQRILFGTSDGRLVALDAESGSPISGFGNGGQVDLTEGLHRPVEAGGYSVSSPPLVVGDVVVVGSSITDPRPRSERPPGCVQAFDVRTGERLWTFHPIPREGKHGNETWEEDSWRTVGNTNVWTVMSADPERGLVYLPVSTPTNDWYGGHRPGDNLFAESLVALEAATGERRWHFQVVHHGVWDYDLPAAPNLVEIEVEGERIPAVAQVTKQGFTFVFDRTTGEPVWPVEERPVPASTVPGERLSPTQPFPTKPPPFEVQELSEETLLDFTPELRRRAEEVVSRFHHGPIYTPPMPPDSADLLQIPGALGGANWNGAAVDPETGVLYVPSITLPNRVELLEPDAEVSDYRYIENRSHPNLFPTVDGLPLTKPPYGRVTAIDLNRGEIAWQAPLGEGPRDHPALEGLDLPRLGWPNRGFPLLTETLLFVGQEPIVWPNLPALVGGEPDAETAEKMTRFDPKLYAYDKKTGDLITELELPANVTGAPATYMSGGKQYIVFPTGGAAAPGELIALSLP